MPRKKPTIPGFGIDFGTTNCSIAHARQGAVTLARFTGGVESSRSILYAESQSAQRSRWYSGPAAISQYLDADAKGRLIQSLKSFLASRSHEARKQIRRERRAVADAGLDVRVVTGPELTDRKSVV